jgi:hypothetical protein
MNVGPTEFMRQLHERTQDLIRDLSAEGERLSALAVSIKIDTHQFDQLSAIARDLLKSNGELRGRLDARDDELSHIQQLLERERALSQEGVLRYEELHRQVAAIEQDNRGLASRCGSLERQTATLTQLYAALYRLSDAIDEAGVITCITEIINGLIGSEELALVEVATGGSITTLASMGLDEAAQAAVVDPDGEVARALRTAQPFFRETGGPAGPAGLTACVVLKAGGRVNGAIAIFGLLPQKPSLVRLDRELLDLLASHAGRALQFARLQAGTLR